MNIRRLACVLVLAVVACVLVLSDLRPAMAHTIACTECHRVENISEGAWREAICLKCHGPGGSSTLRALSHAGLDCIDCHDWHGGQSNRLGGTNLQDLRANVDRTGRHSDWPATWLHPFLPVINTPPENRVPVVFESRGPDFGEPTLHSFADGDEDGDGIFDGICEACHLAYLQTEQHHTGETCTSCHPHNRGFRIAR